MVAEDEQITTEPVTIIVGTTSGCGLCGSVEHVALSCPLAQGRKQSHV